MSVGLIDQDCLNHQRDFVYDLDIMKLASYYKHKGEITKLLLDITEYTQYTKTYFIKNKFDYKLFNQLFKDERLIYRGYAFYGKDFEPLELDIEHAPADVSIYDKYLKFNDQLPNRRIPVLTSKNIIGANHCRFSYDGKNANVEDRYINYRNSKNLYIYDYNFFDLEGWKDRLKDYKEFKASFRFPPITKNLDDIKDILESCDITSENHFILSKQLSMPEIKDVINLGKNHKDRIRIEILNNLNPSNKELFYDQIIYSLNSILALKHSKTRIHSWIDLHYITKQVEWINNIGYWANRNHSDVSFYYWLTEIRKRWPAVRNLDNFSKENSTIQYLLNVKPSEWESVL